MNLIGNSINDYIQGTPSKGIISDTIIGKQNGNSAITQAIDDYVKTPNTSTFDKTKFANALLSGASSLGKSSGSTSTKPQFEVTPSRVDYSQYMGLSPVTQQYLTRYM